MKAIRIHSYGGPDVLQLDEIERPEPAPGFACVRVRTAGVNFIDVYQRTGRYSGSLPFTPGMEGAGVVESVGEGVYDLKPGDRVGWASYQGSYAEVATIPAARLIPLPSAVSDEVAGAVLLQGMTAHYLARSTYPIHDGDTVVVHAAAGGVGLLLTQMAKRLGARVIGTVSTEEKKRLAQEAGADHVVIYTEADFEAAVREFTGGKGADVVYDSVGKATFRKSLASLKPLGMLVLFGASSGAVEPFDPIDLMKGSWFLTRPTLFNYTADRESLLRRAGDVFRWIEEGWLHVRIDRAYPLAAAASAHRDLESRKTAGKLVLIS